MNNLGFYCIFDMKDIRTIPNSHSDRGVFSRLTHSSFRACPAAPSSKTIIAGEPVKEPMRNVLCSTNNDERMFIRSYDKKRGRFDILNITRLAESQEKRLPACFEEYVCGHPVTGMSVVRDALSLSRTSFLFDPSVQFLSRTLFSSCPASHFCSSVMFSSVSFSTMCIGSIVADGTKPSFVTPVILTSTSITTHMR